MDEPDITINGKNLTVGQAMTLRVALGSFMLSLSDDDALGGDEHGRAMTKAYRERGREVAYIMTEQRASPDRRAEKP